ncbi:MAG: alpha/beta fold hydrolase [Gammaproteobacteria bacterium]|nr:alpha/beta fold hydrolase [Pseudomonadales bacterium]MCP5349162.1 alpha/beta fold hydrolase [Pseudomonadales bacterium]
MRLNFRQFSEAGPPLLVLHGLFGNLRNWSWHAAELASEFSVYGLDLRNHGESPHTDSMSYAEMAGDVLEFLESRALADVNLLGHSMGGKVAMQLALGSPQRVRRLLVADIAPVAYAEERGDHENVFQGLLAVDPGSLASRAEAEEVLSAHISEFAVVKFLASNLVREAHGYRWRFNLKALHANYARLREGVVADGVFENPTLFIKGALSNYITQQDWPRIQLLFPAARIKTMMGAGHWLHAEKPQVFYKLARDFFTAEEFS